MYLRSKCLCSCCINVHRGKRSMERKKTMADTISAPPKRRAGCHIIYKKHTWVTKDETNEKAAAYCCSYSSTIATLVVKEIKCHAIKNKSIFRASGIITAGNKKKKTAETLFLKIIANKRPPFPPDPLCSEDMSRPHPFPPASTVAASSRRCLRTLPEIRIQDFIIISQQPLPIFRHRGRRP